MTFLRPPVAQGHRRSRVAARLLTTFVITAALLLAVALPSAGAATPAATPAPRAQMRSAVQQMSTVGGYTFSAAVGHTGPNGVKIAGEYQAPDRIHEVIQIGTSPASELVMIGSAVYAKDATGKWQRARAANATQSDLRTTFAALRSAKDVSRKGSSITFTLAPAATKQLAGSQATGKTKGQVTLDGSHIARLKYTATVNGAKVPVRIDYTVTDPPPTVTAPL